MKVELSTALDRFQLEMEKLLLKKTGWGRIELKTVMLEARLNTVTFLVGEGNKE